MENNQKLTAVEWLGNKITNRITRRNPHDTIIIQILGETLIELIEQAKEMDKERLTDAYCDGKANGMDISHPLSLTKEISANEWYEQTYGGNK
jgi:hypothetical protein